MRGILFIFASLTEAMAAEQFAAKSADGSGYIGDSLSSAVEKRSAGLSTVYWRREGEYGRATRSLRVTPDGGVVRLALAVDGILTASRA